MKTVLAVLISTLLFPAMGLSASTDVPPADREQVLKVVQEFFDALAGKQVEAYRALFVPGAQITAARLTAEGLVLRQRSVEEDLQKMPANSNRLLERMWNPTVHVQGRIAAVWTPYDFHTNGRFSHSGIDVFSLVKTATGWKIASAVYSVEPEAPSRHPAGPP